MFKQILMFLVLFSAGINCSAFTEMDTNPEFTSVPIEILDTGVLPIDLISFTADAHQDHVELSYEFTVLDRTNLLEVKRSTSGSPDTWETVHVILNQESANNVTDANIKERIKDFPDEPNLYYYKLTEAYDSSSGLVLKDYTTVAVAFSGSKWKNPVPEGTVISLNDVNLQLYNYAGELIDQGPNISLDSQGVYILIMGENLSFSDAQRIVVMRE